MSASTSTASILKRPISPLVGRQPITPTKLAPQSSEPLKSDQGGLTARTSAYATA